MLFVYYKLDVWLIMSLILNTQNNYTTGTPNLEHTKHCDKKLMQKFIPTVALIVLLLDYLCLENTYILTSILLLKLITSGDIEPNPGPQIVDYEDMIKRTSRCPRFLSLNAQNLFHKHTEWKLLVHDHRYKTILGITETWFDEQVADSLWTIDRTEHAIFRDDRSTELSGKVKGGGVLMLVPQNLNPVIRDDINSFRKSLFDSLWVECDDFTSNTKNRQLICVVYNPSKAYKNMFLADLAVNMDKAIVEQKPITIMGDFNINYFCATEQRDIDNIIQPYGMHISNSLIPTRFNSTSATLIDYIITDIQRSNSVYIADPPLRTDHRLTLLSLELCKDEHKCKKIKSFDKTKYNKERFLQRLRDANWAELYQKTDTTGMIDSFNSIIQRSLKATTPEIVKYIRKGNGANKPKDKPWITQECKHILEQKKLSFKEYTNNKTTENYAIYKKLRNKANNILKSAETSYTRQHIETLHNPKRKWNFINKLRQSKNHTTDIKLLKNSFGDTLTEAKKIANLLNYKFTTLGQYIGVKKDYRRREKVTDAHFAFHIITENEMSKCMRQINTSKSPGLCIVPPWAYKDSAEVASEHLCFIFNYMVLHREFPQALKSGMIKPIFKGGDESNPISYRPISLTAPLAKVFEKLLHKQISIYLNRHGLLSNRQFGFRNTISATDALISTIESFRVDTDKGNSVALALLDLSKAFDSINHTILLNKLQSIGFDDTSIELISSYLSNRQQIVNVNGVYSDWLNVVRGVPQGTVLGPLLFNIYVNELSQSTNCRITQYADDTCIFVSGKDVSLICDQLAGGINVVIDFLEEHELMINVQKTKFLILGSKANINHARGISIQVRGTKIVQSDSAKYLGVVIENDLSFGKQLNSVLGKMAVGIKTITAIRDYFPLVLRQTLLRSLVLSHLDYSAIFFTSLKQAELMSLQRQLNWGIKATHYRTKYASSHDLKIKYSILSGENTITLKCFMYFLSLGERSEAARLYITVTRFFFCRILCVTREPANASPRCCIARNGSDGSEGLQ